MVSENIGFKMVNHSGDDRRRAQLVSHARELWSKSSEQRHWKFRIVFFTRPVISFGPPLPLNRVVWLVTLYFRSHGIIKNDNHVTYVNRLAFEPKYSSQIEFLIDFHACVKDFLVSEVYFLCVVSCDKLRTPWISCFARGGTLFNSCVSGFGFVLSC